MKKPEWFITKNWSQIRHDRRVLTLRIFVVPDLGGQLHRILHRGADWND